MFLNISNIFSTKEYVGEFQIIVSVIFFGISFVLARYAMIDKSIGPITFTACRFIVSTTFIYIFRPCTQKLLHSEVIKDKNQIDNVESYLMSDKVQLWLLGSICGLASFFASSLLQVGLVTVSAGKAGFITGMYVVFIPVVEYLIPGFGVQLTWRSWVASILCIIGLYLISGCAEQAVCIGGALKEGEVLIVVSMLCWIVSIMVGDIGAKRLDVISFTLVDFFVSTVLTIILAVVVEPESWVYPFHTIISNLFVIFAMGVTEAVAFPLSTLGQMYVAPTRASLLMSMESLTCAILGYLFLRETLSYVELLGCVLMFVATLFSTTGVVMTPMDSEADSEADNRYCKLGDVESDSLSTASGDISERQPFNSEPVVLFGSIPGIEMMKTISHKQQI